jgi:hypothetical protein
MRRRDRHGLNLIHMTVLIASTIAIAGAAVVLFARRDLRT